MRQTRVAINLHLSALTNAISEKGAV